MTEFKHHGEIVDPATYAGRPYGLDPATVLDPKNGINATCFFCSKPNLTYDIGAMSPKYRCCEGCIRARGLSALRDGADEALSALKSRTRKPEYCGHCGAALVQPQGKRMVLWCDACERERPKMKAGG